MWSILCSALAFPSGNSESWREAMKDQFFADYLERLENLQHRLHKAVRELPAETMDWSPGPAMNPKMNSVAVLLGVI